MMLTAYTFVDDHTTLPGITIGDIGPKSGAGFAPTDNGFARFNHIRIPKENMLSAFAQVTEEGKYKQPPHAKLSYGGVRFSFSFAVRHVDAGACRCSTSVPSKSHSCKGSL